MSDWFVVSRQSLEGCDVTSIKSESGFAMVDRQSASALAVFATEPKASLVTKWLGKVGTLVATGLNSSAKNNDDAGTSKSNKCLY